MFAKHSVSGWAVMPSLVFTVSVFHSLLSPIATINAFSLKPCVLSPSCCPLFPSHCISLSYPLAISCSPLWFFCLSCTTQIPCHLPIAPTPQSCHSLMIWCTASLQLWQSCIVVHREAHGVWLDLAYPYSILMHRVTFKCAWYLLPFFITQGMSIGYMKQFNIDKAYAGYM